MQRAWDANVAAAQYGAYLKSAAIAAANASRLDGDMFVAPFLDAMLDPGPAWPFGELPRWHRRIGQPQRPPEFRCLHTS